MNPRSVSKKPETNFVKAKEDQQKRDKKKIDNQLAGSVSGHTGTEGRGSSKASVVNVNIGGRSARGSSIGRRPKSAKSLGSTATRHSAGSHKSDKHDRNGRDHHHDKKHAHSGAEHDKKPHNNDMSHTGAHVHTPETYLRSSIQLVNNLIQKFCLMPVKADETLKYSALTAMTHEAEDMNAWFYEDQTGGEPNPAHKTFSVYTHDTEESPKKAVDIDMSLNPEATAKLLHDNAKASILNTAKHVSVKMTKAGQQKFDDIADALKKDTACLLGRPQNHCSGDKEFQFLHIRSDVFKELITEAHLSMNQKSHTANTVSEVETCIKAPPCVCSVDKVMDILVPTALWKQLPFTYMSAMPDIHTIKNDTYRDQYHELLVKTMKNYLIVKNTYHKQLAELKVNDEDDERSFMEKNGIGEKGDYGIETPKPRTNAMKKKELETKYVALMETTVTDNLEMWFMNRQDFKVGKDGKTTEARDAATYGCMSDYGFSNGMTANQFVTFFINHAIKISESTWGEPTVMCNRLELDHPAYKGLQEWVKTYAEGYVKLYEGHHVVNHNNHFTEDEHTINVATAIWLISKAKSYLGKKHVGDDGKAFAKLVVDGNTVPVLTTLTPDPTKFSLFKKDMDDDKNHFNARKFMTYATKLDFLVNRVRNIEAPDLMNEAVAYHWLCATESVTNKLLHSLLHHIHHPVNIFEGTYSSVVQDSILADNFCVLNSHLFANQGILQSCAEIKLPKLLEDKNLFKLFSIRVDHKYITTQGLSGVAVMRKIQQLCSYRDTRSLLYRLGRGLIEKPQLGNRLLEEEAAKKRCLGWWITWKNVGQADMCVPPVAHTRFDKTYMMKGRERTRHTVGTDDDGKRLSEYPKDKFRDGNFKEPPSARGRRSNEFAKLSPDDRRKSRVEDDSAAQDYDADSSTREAPPKTRRLPPIDREGSRDIAPETESKYPAQKAVNFTHDADLDDVLF
jgi:hypothetical protein